MTIDVHILLRHGGAVQPERKTPGSSGYDLSYDGSKGTIVVAPGSVVWVPTGISVSMPAGLELQIRPRSGLSSRGIFMANTIGTVDSDFRGEINVLLWTPYAWARMELHGGERVAQAVFATYESVKFIQCIELDETYRGEGGYGSTGV